MFVRYFAELPFPLEAVEEMLLRSPEGWIPGLAHHAEDVGEQLLVDSGFGSAGQRAAERMVVGIKEPVRFPSRTILPMTWRAAAGEAPYPETEADIEVASLGQITQLSVSARYRPPTGTAGRTVDRMLLHRVVEATVKDFVDRARDKLVALLESSVSTAARE